VNPQADRSAVRKCSCLFADHVGVYIICLATEVGYILGRGTLLRLTPIHLHTSYGLGTQQCSCSCLHFHPILLLLPTTQNLRLVEQRLSPSHNHVIIRCDLSARPARPALLAANYCFEDSVFIVVPRRIIAVETSAPGGVSRSLLI